MRSKKQGFVWTPDACDLMRRLCDVLELSDRDRFQWPPK